MRISSSISNLVVFLAAVPLFANTADPDCAAVGIQTDVLKRAVAEFRADCARYPKTLVELLAKPSNCAAWGGAKGPYLKDQPFTRTMIKGFAYAAEADGFKLRPKKTCG